MDYRCYPWRIRHGLIEAQRLLELSLVHGRVIRGEFATASLKPETILRLLSLLFRSYPWRIRHGLIEACVVASIS